MQTLGYLAGVAAEAMMSSADLRALAGSPVLHSGAALLALVVATTLSVDKSHGTTSYGWRKQRREHTS